MKVVSRWTKIPLATLDQEENDKLIHLAKKLHEHVIGQDEAVKESWLGWQSSGGGGRCKEEKEEEKDVGVKNEEGPPSLFIRKR